MMRITLIAALGLAGCTTPHGDAKGGQARQASRAERPADAPGVAFGGLNETIAVADVTVRPLAVAEDSRCPVNVACVWSGRLVLRAAIAAVPGEALLSSLEPYPLADGGALVLESVWPPNLHGAPPVRGPYRFGFRRRP